MHLSIFLWGFTGVLGKAIELNEGLLVWYRLMISSVVILLIMLYRKSFKKISFRSLIAIIGVGFLVMLHWVTFYGAIKISNVSITLSCLSSIALFTSILEPLFNKAKFDYVEILFSGLAMAGIFTIYRSDTSAIWGIVVALISSLFSATFATLNKKLVAHHEPFMITIIELTGGLVILTFLLPFYFHYIPTTKFIPSSSDWIYLLILSLFCTVLTWILSLSALKRVTAFTAALALNLEPVYGITLAIVLMHEHKMLNTGFYTGTAIILLTVGLHAFYKYSKNKKDENAAGTVLFD